MQLLFMCNNTTSSQKNKNSQIHRITESNMEIVEVNNNFFNIIS